MRFVRLEHVFVMHEAPDQRHRGVGHEGQEHEQREPSGPDLGAHAQRA